MRKNRRLKAATVWANTYGPTDVRLPWGGTRDSGFGREHGEAAIENFTETKTVWIKYGSGLSGVARSRIKLTPKEQHGSATADVSAGLRGSDVPGQTGDGAHA